MDSICILLVVACASSLLLTPLIRDLGSRLGLVDRPDGHRKRHPVAVPRAGGISIVLSYGIACGALLMISPGDTAIGGGNLWVLWRLLPSLTVVFTTGLVDDWLSLPPWQKILAEVVAASWVYAAGVRIAGPDGGANPWCSLLLTVAWLVLCSNAFNLVDGVDGLAAGLGLTAAASAMTAGIWSGNPMLALATAPLAGALIGFVRYNFSPASIFLGDSGSLSIGFLLGVSGILWGQAAGGLLGMVAPLMALGVPLMETVVSVLRRFLRNEPIFVADRGHIHHRLLDRGFTPRRVSLLLYAAGGIGAGLALLQSVIRGRFAGIAIACFAGITWAGVRYLRYAEFRATARFLLRGLRPLVGAHVESELLERSVASATSAQECWEALERTGRLLGYSHMAVRFGSASFGSAAGHPRGEAFWEMRLNLSENCQVTIMQGKSSAEQAMLAIPFAEAIQRVLLPKLAELGAGRAAQSAEISASLARLAEAVQNPPDPQFSPRNSKTTSVISSDCGVPSVKAATAS